MKKPVNTVFLNLLFVFLIGLFCQDTYAWGYYKLRLMGAKAKPIAVVRRQKQTFIKPTNIEAQPVITLISVDSLSMWNNKNAEKIQTNVNGAPFNKEETGIENSKPPEKRVYSSIKLEGKLRQVIDSVGKKKSETKGFFKKGIDEGDNDTKWENIGQFLFSAVFLVLSYGFIWLGIRASSSIDPESSLHTIVIAPFAILFLFTFITGAALLLIAIGYLVYRLFKKQHKHKSK